MIWKLRAGALKTIETIIEAGLSAPPHHALFIQRDTFRQRVGGADRFLLDDDRRRIDVALESSSIPVLVLLCEDEKPGIQS